MNVVMIYLTFSVLLVALGVPLALGKVPPNPLYGFRTPATQADPTLWYPVNTRTGLDLIICGLVLGFVAWVLPKLVQLSSDVYMGAWTTSIVAALLFVFVRSGLLLRRLQKERGEG
jgi:uncharacterized membrane protein